MANPKLEPRKAPLPIFIANLCYERFGRELPEIVVTIEQRARQIAEDKAARRATNVGRRADAGGGGTPS